MILLALELMISVQRFISKQNEPQPTSVQAGGRTRIDREREKSRAQWDRVRFAGSRAQLRVREEQV
jgi:hypothetical protein